MAKLIKIIEVNNMIASIEKIYNDISKDMEICIEKFQEEILRLRTGRANKDLINHLSVSCYGATDRLDNLSSITIPEARQLLIKPYDLEIINNIVNALNKADINASIIVDSQVIRITLPSLSEEVRKDSIKKLGKITENYRIHIRNLRRDFLHSLKKQEISEDIIKNQEKEIQKLTDDNTNKLNALEKTKAQELLRV